MNLRILIALLLLVPCAAFADELIFSGTPNVRIDSDGATSNTHELSANASHQYTCRIVKNGRKYLWASRGNRELIRSDSGDFTYYVSPEGTGYVKVFTGKRNPDVKLRFDYLESFSTELKTLTYWGHRDMGSQ